MKKTYQTPCMSIEMFSANQAVSACTVNSSYSWEFDCMVGDRTDFRTGIINSNLASGCDSQIGYQRGCTTARDYGGTNNHSDNSPSIADWSYVSTGWYSGYSQVTYTGAQGLLYVDSDGKEAQHWSFDAENNMMVHDNSGNRVIHHNVAPVLNETSVNPSW